MPSTNSLAIIMCTYNGAEFLQEQLNSFSNQTFKNWKLFVYDDGSTDTTKDLIKRYQQQSAHEVVWSVNPQQMGFAKNFLNAICITPTDFDFFALSDQDDIWCEAKLERAVAYLQTIPQTTPAVFCSRTRLIDANGNHIGLSPLFKKAPSFCNALVQSIAGGNTFVFNRAARDLIAVAGKDVNIVSHDWWIYQLVSGAGGMIHYDSHPEVLYRQHGSNLIGTNKGIGAKFTRLKLALQGNFKSWNDKNLNALDSCSQLLIEHNRKILHDFITVRKLSLIPRLIGLIKVGIYRQIMIDNLALFIAGVMNKI